ncbi:MAG: adenosylcobinamide-GDP ribazoletransferase [Sporichthyaceae bacterium]
MSGDATEGDRASAGLALALSMLTVLPVGRVRINRDVAGAAMLWAPAVGAALGALATGAAVLLAELDLSTLACAALAVALLALASRGLHLDGLADTADGLGVGRDRERSLAVMKASDIGPFGVLTLVFVVLLQVVALAGVLARWDDGQAILAGALVGAVSRGTLPWACRRGVPAARSDGLGAMVAGTVRPVVGVAVAAAIVVGTTGLGWAADFGVLRSLCAAVLALIAADLLARRCRARFGGITGDTLGAGVEVAATVALLVLSTA